MGVSRRAFLWGTAAMAGGAGGLADGAPAADPLVLWRGLWVQEDSGGVLEFRADGKVAGVPVSGSYRFPEAAWIEITSGSEVLKCRWQNRGDDAITLARFIEGNRDAIELLRLKPVPLDFAKWKGRCVIRHLVAGGKSATERAVTLEPTGHFRTKEGGYYLRLLPGKDGQILGYASGHEDETTVVQLLAAGRHLVVFDRLEKPRLFASCLFVD